MFGMVFFLLYGIFMENIFFGIKYFIGFIISWLIKEGFVEIIWYYGLFWLRVWFKFYKFFIVVGIYIECFE